MDTEDTKESVEHQSPQDGASDSAIADQHLTTATGKMTLFGSGVRGGVDDANAEGLGAPSKNAWWSRSLSAPFVQRWLLGKDAVGDKPRTIMSRDLVRAIVVWVIIMLAVLISVFFQ